MRLSTNSYPITLDFSTQTSFTYFMAFSIVSMIVSRPQARKVILFYFIFFFSLLFVLPIFTDFLSFLVAQRVATEFLLLKGKNAVAPTVNFVLFSVYSFLLTPF